MRAQPSSEAAASKCSGRASQLKPEPGVHDARCQLNEGRQAETARDHASAVEGDPCGDAGPGAGEERDRTTHAEPDHGDLRGREALRREQRQGGVDIRSEVVRRQGAHDLDESLSLLGHLERLVVDDGSSLAVVHRRGDRPVALSGEPVDDLADVLGEAEGLLDHDDGPGRPVGSCAERRDRPSVARDLERLRHLSRRRARRSGCA